ncbi:MAG: cytochrome P450 [Acidimicrobiia bacterium]
MTAVDHAPIDLLDRAMYAGDPSPTYAWLRRNAPAYWSEAAGLWGVSRYADIVAIEKQPEIFSNGVNGSRPNTPKNDSMIDHDDPRHKGQRRFVYKGFTPRALAEKEDHARSIVGSLIDAVAGKGECDFVQELAAPLPMILIAEMLGVRPEDRDTLQHWSDVMLSGADGIQNVTEEVMTAHLDFVQYALDVMEARRAEPRADLISTLVHSEIDGEKMTDEAIVSEALLLLVGGNETTRNVISGGMEMLIRHPDQRQQLIDDPTLIPTAVEECLRWVTPILNMNRTATQDVELHGQTIREGDQVLLMFASANRDPEAFDAPEEFVITRDPNPHVAFGFGPHFCLGANLARLEVRVMFEEVLRRLPDLQLATDDVARTPSSFVRGIMHMPVTFSKTH